MRDTQVCSFFFFFEKKKRFLFTVLHKLAQANAQELANAARKCYRDICKTSVLLHAIDFIESVNHEMTRSRPCSRTMISYKLRTAPESGSEIGAS